MFNRRTFSTLLAGSIAAPRLSWAQQGTSKTALYSGVGTEFTHYDVDIEAAVLAKRASMELPSSIQ
jgi:hypothetical protein